MFIQVIEGRTSRPEELKALFEEWRRELSPGADGWLGSTQGVDDDGMFVGVVRFETREQAMANSNRPEQGEWAERMRALFDGEPEFRDYDDVTVMMEGGSDRAGFVQVIEGKVDDIDRLKRMMTSDIETLHQMRPDIIGSTLACAPDGSYTETVAFTSEQEARAGESQEPPEDVRTELAWAMAGARFHDLHQPQFLSPQQT